MSTAVPDSQSEISVDCHLDPVAGAKILAAAFDAGRRLAVSSRLADHAHHVVVEFLHPVVTGSVALPAAVLSTTSPVSHASATTPSLADSNDIVLTIGHLDDVSVDGVPVDAASADGVSADAVHADLHIPAVSDAETMVAYHLLWELVQLELATVAEPDGDSTDFLYPFLDGGADDGAVGETDGDLDVGDHLRASALEKAAESRHVSQAALEANQRSIKTVADTMVGAGGARVLTMGNGGSACDAARAVRLFTDRGVSAQSLASEYAVVTALSNDLGPNEIFARQIEALGRPGDVLIGFSTSGTSGNLLAAFDRAKSRGLTTVGFAGYDGTGFSEHPSVDHTLAVASQSVHRIQEAQAVLLADLVDQVGRRLATS